MSRIRRLLKTPARFESAAMLAAILLLCIPAGGVLVALHRNAVAGYGEAYHDPSFDAGMLAGGWAVALIAGPMFIVDALIRIARNRLWPEQEP